jgi:hypothetical protein
LQHQKGGVSIYIIKQRFKCLDEFYIREQLKEKEDRLRHEFEQHDAIQQQKRVELYEANFNAELEDYKRRRENEVSSLYSRKFVAPRQIYIRKNLMYFYKVKHQLQKVYLWMTFN